MQVSFDSPLVGSSIKSENLLTKNKAGQLSETKIGQDPAELIALQVALYNYHLKVELVSKVAESGNSTLRRLSQGG